MRDIGLFVIITGAIFIGLQLVGCVTVETETGNPLTIEIHWSE